MIGRSTRTPSIPRRFRYSLTAAGPPAACSTRSVAVLSLMRSISSSRLCSGRLTPGSSNRSESVPPGRRSVGFSTIARSSRSFPSSIRASSLSAIGTFRTLAMGNRVPLLSTTVRPVSMWMAARPTVPSAIGASRASSRSRRGSPGSAACAATVPWLAAKSGMARSRTRDAWATWGRHGAPLWHRSGARDPTSEASLGDCVLAARGSPPRHPTPHPQRPGARRAGMPSSRDALTGDRLLPASAST